MYYYNSPIGILKIEYTKDAITNLSFEEENKKNNNQKNHTTNMSHALKQCIYELDSYFNKTLTVFKVPIKLQGTEFRIKVWQALLTIEFGETKSYADIATIIDAPKAIRAVGGANHHNNISIIVPCHRVIGKNGKLTGYGGGLWRKEWLLEHEKNTTSHSVLI